MFQTITTIDKTLLGTEIVLVLTCVYLFFTQRGSRKTWQFVFFSFFLAITCSWRLLLGIISSRYALILTIAAIMALVYFVYNFSTIAGVFVKKPYKAIDFLRNNMRGIARCLIIVLTVALFCKVMRGNPYHKDIINIMYTLDAEMAASRDSLLFNYYDGRLRFYVKNSNKKNTFFLESDLSRENIQKDIAAHPEVKELFFIGKISKKVEVSPDYQDFLKKSSLIKLGESWVDKRKRSKIVLYRYTRSREI